MKLGIVLVTVLQAVSDQSDEGGGIWIQKSFSTQDDSKKLDYPSQQHDCMPEPLGGKDEIQNQIRHFTETKTTIETQSQDLRNPTNSNTLDETEIVHLGKKFSK